MYAGLHSSTKKPSTALEGGVGGPPSTRACSLASLLNQQSTCTLGLPKHQQELNLIPLSPRTVPQGLHMPWLAASCRFCLCRAAFSATACCHLVVTVATRESRSVWEDSRVRTWVFSCALAAARVSTCRTQGHRQGKNNKAHVAAAVSHWEALCAAQAVNGCCSMGRELRCTETLQVAKPPATARRSC